MSKASQAVLNLLDHIGKGTVDQTYVAFVISIFGIPFPLYWHALLKALERGAPAEYFNPDYVNLYYSLSPLMSITYGLLAVTGLLLIRKGINSLVYCNVTLQAFGIITFLMCAFFGLFVTPVAIILVMSISIGILVLDKNTLFAGVFTLFVMFIIASLLHWAGKVPPVPILNELAVLDTGIRGWAVTVFAVFILFFTGGFYLMLYQLVKSTRQKREQLQTIATKLANLLTPQVYNSIVEEEAPAGGDGEDTEAGATTTRQVRNADDIQSATMQFLGDFHYSSYNRNVQDEIIQALLEARKDKE